MALLEILNRFKEKAMEKAQELYSRMKRKDFSAIIDTAVRECGVKTRDRAEKLLDAFLQWFALIPEAVPTQPLQMLRSVDRIWHAMILNTAFYREFCNEFVGGFVDHNPLDVVRDASGKRTYADHTLMLVERTYGEGANAALYLLREDVTCCCGCGPTTTTNPVVEMHQ